LTLVNGLELADSCRDARASAPADVAALAQETAPDVSGVTKMSVGLDENVGDRAEKPEALLRNFQIAGAVTWSVYRRCFLNHSYVVLLEGRN